MTKGAGKTRLGAALRQLWREQRIALVAFVLALMIALFFAGRMVVFTLYWADPAHRELAPEGWMTTGYVARSWKIDRGELGGALDVSPTSGRPRTLAQIAAERGQSLPTFLAEVAVAAAALKAARAP